jgi:hypothetical protein
MLLPHKSSLYYKALLMSYLANNTILKPLWHWNLVAFQSEMVDLNLKEAFPWRPAEVDALIARHMVSG